MVSPSKSPALDALQTAPLVRKATGRAVERSTVEKATEDGSRNSGQERERERGAGPWRDAEYRMNLPQAGFEGPLDLLLHLIQEHELDILDIPIGFITERFLAYLKLMDLLSIDIASEYLVMAATLAHIKSKMLLPVVPVGQEDDGLPAEEEDPRAELVLRLLEYQKYKAAAAELAERGTLGKDIFGAGCARARPRRPGALRIGVGLFTARCLREDSQAHERPNRPRGRVRPD